MMNRRVVVHSDHRPIPEGMNRPMKQKNNAKDWTQYHQELARRAQPTAKASRGR